MNLLEVAKWYAESLERKVAKLQDEHVHLITSCDVNCDRKLKLEHMKYKLAMVKSAINKSEVSSVK